MRPTQEHRATTRPIRGGGRVAPLRSPGAEPAAAPGSAEDLIELYGIDAIAACQAGPLSWACRISGTSGPSGHCPIYPARPRYSEHSPYIRHGHGTPGIQSRKDGSPAHGHRRRARHIRCRRSPHAVVEALAVKHRSPHTARSAFVGNQCRGARRVGDSGCPRTLILHLRAIVRACWRSYGAGARVVSSIRCPVCMH